MPITVPTTGRRNHFKFAITSTPTLLVLGGERYLVYFFNEGATGIRLGLSGSISQGVVLPAGQEFYDDVSRDEWWAILNTGTSGTISGYVVS